MALVTVPKKHIICRIYFCSSRHISLHIGISYGKVMSGHHSTHNIKIFGYVDINYCNTQVIRICEFPKAFQTKYNIKEDIYALKHKYAQEILMFSKAIVERLTLEKNARFINYFYCGRTGINQNFQYVTVFDPEM